MSCLGCVVSSYLKLRPYDLNKTLVVKEGCRGVQATLPPARRNPQTGTHPTGLQSSPHTIASWRDITNYTLLTIIQQPSV